MSRTQSYDVIAAPPDVALQVKVTVCPVVGADGEAVTDVTVGGPPLLPPPPPLPPLPPEAVATPTEAMTSDP